LNSADGKRRILLVQRADGFRSVEQHWYQNIYEGGTLAEREARARYPWLV
jgi:hypothetical protein